MEAFIYVLKDPNTLEIRYVGKTVNLKRRFYHHCSMLSNKRQKTHRSSWINSILLNNQKPIIEVIESCKYENWEKREVFWIDYYKGLGYNLCNHTYGGSGALGSKVSDETKEKISKNNGKGMKIYKTVYRFNSTGKYIDSFKNPTIASEQTGVYIQKILRSCRNEYVVTDGFIWSYNKNDNRKSLKNMEKCKKVICMDLIGNFIREYESVSSAARDLKTSSSNISNCCKNKPSCKSIGGFKWKYKN